MTCEEFQRVLPFIIESGGNPEEEEHLRTCKICSDLVADLKYIADQAKLLVPMEDPSPKVWNGIEKRLEEEGLVRPTGHRRRLLGHQGQKGRWAIPILLIALLLGFGMLQRGSPGKESAEPGKLSASATVTENVTEEDQQVLSSLPASTPVVRATYESGFRTVNANIADTTQHLAQNPEDMVAREFLNQAYKQKQMLYRMALTRSEP